MAENILTIFVYIIFLTFTVCLVNAFAALFQVIEDIRPIRRKIWEYHSRTFKKLHNAHH